MWSSRLFLPQVFSLGFPCTDLQSYIGRCDLADVGMFMTSRYCKQLFRENPFYSDCLGSIALLTSSGDHEVSMGGDV